ncbi:MAG TPA: HAD family phosphatase, partial [Candidatus Andersenbacteria bacterium]|nr:HAD family phosphatase [Candidatus Andersenbacteria bacterium]
MIKAVIFDVGGVLKVETDNAIRSDVRETLGIAPEAFDGPWRILTDKLGRGIITEEQFWPRLHGLTGATRPLPRLSLLMREYEKGYLINQDVMEIVERLRKASYKTAILSNTIATHAEFNQDRGLFDGFDPVILSHEVGLRKPVPEIFTLTIDALQLQREETVLVDDLKKNV